MNIKISEDTAALLIMALNNKGKSAARVAVQGFGWGGPVLGIALDEQRENDVVVEKHGVKIVAEKDFAYLLDDAQIVHSRGIFGNRFNISTRNSGSC